MSLLPGHLGGLAKKRNPPLFMHEGDHIEVEIEGIGHLSNVIVEAPAPAVLSERPLAAVSH